MTVGVKLDTRSFEQGIAQLKGKAPQAIMRALNKALTSARVVMVREVARDMGLKQAVVQQGMSTESATYVKPVARLAASLKRVPLIQFNARGPEPSRGRGRGVTARVPGGAGRYPTAFIATMRSGHRGVFERTTTKRLPIRELKGPSVGRVFAKYVPLGLARGQAQLVKNLQSELRYALRPTAA